MKGSSTSKRPFRKRHLFARNVSDVVKEATKPLMNKQGKLYGALLSNWPQIVGPARASVTRPERLQFPTGEEAQGAILHLSAKPSAAPELIYESEAMLEQCARYFGYRAITRIVIHATHHAFSQSDAQPSTPQKPRESAAISSKVHDDIRGVLTRIASHIASASDKQDKLS